MKSDWIALVVLCGVVAAVGAQADPPKTKPLAGWLGVFPELLGYQRTFTAPTVSADKTVYRQMVKYEWTGGAARLLKVTLARDPAFKERYNTATLAKDPLAPAKVMIGDRTGYLWKLRKEGDKDVWSVEARLVVPLAADRALILEAKGPGPWPPLATLATRFDLQKIGKALANPPRTDFRRTLDAFRSLKKGISYREAASWVGFADQDIGSGIHVMVYRLDDGSRVLLGFPDFNRLVYVKHEPKEGKTVDLVD
ncbi:MAG TPA: hypothetical protein VEL76_05995 [Gemmataceae bacterium]|nr:hypothetical protein [Gemmataceae bacterium]